MLHSVRGVITVLVLASAIAGCDRKSYCDQAAIQVSSDSIPVFTWTPPCPVAGCTVYKPQPPALDPVWDILSSQSVVSPPLVYGRSPLPEGSVVPPDTLRPGIVYTVKLFYFDGPFIREVAAATFTVRRLRRERETPPA
jgi:hypothetical protein